jgi:hypothetical protein
VRLALLHPDVAARSCGDCRRFQYLDEPGKFAAAPMRRQGLPVLRPKGTLTPCSWCDKQPADVPPHERTPDTAVELSPKNWRAYQHYLECKAVGQFPDDPIVRRNAALFAQAEKVADRVAQLNAAVLGGSLRGA